MKESKNNDQSKNVLHWDIFDDEKNSQKNVK